MILPHGPTAGSKRQFQPHRSRVTKADLFILCLSVRVLRVVLSFLLFLNLRKSGGHARFCNNSCRVGQSGRRKQAKLLLEEANERGTSESGKGLLAAGRCTRSPSPFRGREAGWTSDGAGLDRPRSEYSCPLPLRGPGQLLGDAPPQSSPTIPSTAVQ